ncbi:hypothetical protein POF50_023415 [Streptomyces sp. SL13]|jgi:hypothetical protein|uniref:Uncharacterized protein n=1 Tax=Streptantibioticus silvisoli TaxID=2705255 RepID=A0AA90H7B4_9ACTN|nr:hypothetical protein [Streptantibioticus silvisoli]MDI5972248.1 hypothetical protein [Streptantibioticus silvisoli]
MSDDVSEVDFEHRDMTPNWAKVSYDTDVWFPMPFFFKGTKWADAAEWAFYYVTDRFRRGGGSLTKREVKKEVVPRAGILVELQNGILHQGGAHKFYIHCPEYHVQPVVISIALWKCRGTREQAFDFYGNSGSFSATTTPVRQSITTENLGEGIRVRWIGQVAAGTYENVNYVWRNEEFDTDILVNMFELNRPRFEEVLPDLDAFVQGIRCTTRPHKSA